MQYSGGEWTLGQIGIGIHKKIMIYSNGDNPVCHVSVTAGNREESENEANAKLIVTVPTQYEELIKTKKDIQVVRATLMDVLGLFGGGPEANGVFEILNKRIESIEQIINKVTL